MSPRLPSLVILAFLLVSLLLLALFVSTTASMPCVTLPRVAGLPTRLAANQSIVRTPRAAPVQSERLSSLASVPLAWLSSDALLSPLLFPSQDPQSALQCIPLPGPRPPPPQDLFILSLKKPFCSTSPVLLCLPMKTASLFNVASTLLERKPKASLGKNGTSSTRGLFFGDDHRTILVTMTAVLSIAALPHACLGWPACLDQPTLCAVRLLNMLTGTPRRVHLQITFLLAGHIRLAFVHHADQLHQLHRVNTLHSSLAQSSTASSLQLRPSIQIERLASSFVSQSRTSQLFSACFPT